MNTALAVFLLANLLVALLRVMRGPTAADRLLAALLFGTTGVAVLLLLAEDGGGPSLIDTALVFALLAAITGAAFAQRAWRRDWQKAGGKTEEEAGAKPEKMTRAHDDR